MQLARSATQANELNIVYFDAPACPTSPPNHITVQRRMLVEVQPGVYEATTQVPSGGTLELVTTTGVQGTSACVPIEVEGSVEVAVKFPRLLIDAVGNVAPGQPTQLRLRLSDDAAQSLRDEYVDLRLAAFDGGWADVVRARQTEPGVYSLEVTFPWAGVFPVAASDLIWRNLLILS